MNSQTKSKKRIWSSETSDMLFNTANIALMVTVCFLILYPIWYTLVYSLNEGLDSSYGGLYWFPRKFTFENYLAVFKNHAIIVSFGVTTARTVIATITSVFMMAMMAYSLTKKELIGRSFFVGLGTITLFFNGGLIPSFLLIKSLGLIDNFLVYILPPMIQFFYVIIFMAFFRELPPALEESAKIDGANDFTIFIRIILPTSIPPLVTVILFVGVWNWNEYFMGVIYIIKNADLTPIQTYLYKIISQNNNSSVTGAGVTMNMLNKTTTSKSLQMAAMFVTTLPVILMYPFLQKYLVKGMMIGAVKG